MKADLVREARLHENDFTLTNNGGSDGPLAGPTVASRASISRRLPSMPLINSESETFDHVLALAGECWIAFRVASITCDRSRISRRSFTSCRRRDARQLIELCEDECSPRVSFETAETKTSVTGTETDMRYKKTSALRFAVGATRSAGRSRISPRNCKSQASTSAEAAFPKSKRASRTWTTKRFSI